MTTVNQLIDRIYRTYLRPPDYQEAITFSVNALTAVATDQSITISNFAIPEDEQLLRIGTLLELDQELVRVQAYDAETQVVTVLRADEGTALATHNAGAKVIMDPSYSRASVFEAVADNIIGLSPKLYTVKVDNLIAVAPGIAPISDPLAAGIISIWDESWSNTTHYHGEILDYHPTTGGRTVATNQNLSSMWVRYKRRMDKATAETETLEDLGVDERWAIIVIIGAAADLLVGRDISAVHTDWISQSLEAETVRPGTRTTIAARLAGYRDILLERFQGEMDAEYRPRVRMRNWRDEVV